MRLREYVNEASIYKVVGKARTHVRSSLMQSSIISLIRMSVSCTTQCDKAEIARKQVKPEVCGLDP